MSGKILACAEGERAERNFFDNMGAAFKLSYSFCCLRGNIYLLYAKMKEHDFNADVKSVLAELHPEYRELLDERFAYTYLIFDMDPHHTGRHDDRAIDTVVRENCARLREMAEYFIDETDPSIGKLYVNYPMMESFRTCNSTFDDRFRATPRTQSGTARHRTRAARRTERQKARLQGRHSLPEWSSTPSSRQMDSTCRLRTIAPIP